MAQVLTVDPAPDGEEPLLITLTSGDVLDNDHIWWLSEYRDGKLNDCPSPIRIPIENHILTKSEMPNGSDLAFPMTGMGELVNVARELLQETKAMPASLLMASHEPEQEAGSPIEYEDKTEVGQCLLRMNKRSEALKQERLSFTTDNNSDLGEEIDLAALQAWWVSVHRQNKTKNKKSQVVVRKKKLVGVSVLKTMPFVL
jgi:hypothetical protein